MNCFQSICPKMLVWTGPKPTSRRRSNGLEQERQFAGCCKIRAGLSLRCRMLLFPSLVWLRLTTHSHPTLAIALRPMTNGPTGRIVQPGSAERSEFTHVLRPAQTTSRSINRPSSTKLMRQRLERGIFVLTRTSARATACPRPIAHPQSSAAVDPHRSRPSYDPTFRVGIVCARSPLWCNRVPSKKRPAPLSAGERETGRHPRVRLYPRNRRQLLRTGYGVSVVQRSAVEVPSRP